ncbi:MAG: hypothetical protein AAF743_08970 [Planctomycetota bacterium]
MAHLLKSSLAGWFHVGTRRDFAFETLECRRLLSADAHDVLRSTVPQRSEFDVNGLDLTVDGDLVVATSSFGKGYGQEQDIHRFDADGTQRVDYLGQAHGSTTSHSNLGDVGGVLALPNGDVLLKVHVSQPDRPSFDGFVLDDSPTAVTRFAWVGADGVATMLPTYIANRTIDVELAGNDVVALAGWYGPGMTLERIDVTTGATTSMPVPDDARELFVHGQQVFVLARPFDPETRARTLAVQPVIGDTLGEPVFTIDEARRLSTTVSIDDAGRWLSSNGHTVQRRFADGTLDATFGDNGTVSTAQAFIDASTVTEVSGGRILVVGGIGYVPYGETGYRALVPDPPPSVMLLEADGTVVDGFEDGRVFVLDDAPRHEGGGKYWARNVLVTDDQLIVGGGHWANPDTGRGSGITVLRVDIDDLADATERTWDIYDPTPAGITPTPPRPPAIERSEPPTPIGTAPREPIASLFATAPLASSLSTDMFALEDDSVDGVA